MVSSISTPIEPVPAVIPPTMAPLDLTGKIVLITGIGSLDPSYGWGNGTATALTLARQGAKLFCCDISSSLLQTGIKQIKSSPGLEHAEITGMVADVTKRDACEELVKACVEKYGRIDVLVNNVGKSEPGDAGSMSEEVWDRQIELNLKTVFLMCHLVLPIMEKQETGGSIVNISSVAGLRYIGKPQVGYSTAKAALIQFSKVNAVIYAEKTGGKVRLNTVVPGLMDTPLVRVLADKYFGGDYEGFKKVRGQQVPSGEMGNAWDVANTVLWFASNESRYVTGQELAVDGGFVNWTGRPSKI